MLTIIHSTSYFLLICFAILFVFLISLTVAFDSFKKKALYCFFLIAFSVYYLAIIKYGCDNIDVDLVYISAFCLPFTVFIVLSLFSFCVKVSGDDDFNGCDNFVIVFMTIFMVLTTALSFGTIHTSRIHHARVYLEQKLDEIQAGKVKVSLPHEYVAYSAFRSIAHSEILLNVISKNGSVELQKYDVITDLVPIKVIGRQNIKKVSLANDGKKPAKSEDDIMIVCHVHGITTNIVTNDEDFDAIIPLNDYTQLVHIIRQASIEAVEEGEKKDSDQKSLQKLLAK